jgi:hypothetical protein
MRIEGSAAGTRQIAAQTSGTDAATQFAPPERSTLPVSVSLFFNKFCTLYKTCKNRPFVSNQLRTLYFHSLAFPKWQSPCFQSTAHSWPKTTRGGGGAFMKYFKFLPILHVGSRHDPQEPLPYGSGSSPNWDTVQASTSCGLGRTGWCIKTVRIRTFDIPLTG